jgi:hypothetical protein
MDLQQKILDGTLAAVNAFSVVKIAINAVVYAVVGGMLVYVVFPGTFDAIVALACVGFGVVYAYARDFFLHRQIKLVLASHVQYVRAKHPQVQLYVPMLDKVGSSVLLKRSGLFIEDGELALEAFNQPAFAKVPKDSITVPCGVDFRIFEATDDAKKPLTGFRAELMRNPYQFFVLKDPETVARIAAYGDAAGKEA